jgi:hypothetical protein
MGAPGRTRISDQWFRNSLRSLTVSDSSDALRPIEANSKLLLEAITRGDVEDANRLSLVVAEAVEALPLVTLARQVREGGPLAIARAVTLATMLLNSEASHEGHMAFSLCGSRP